MVGRIAKVIEKNKNGIENSISVKGQLERCEQTM